MAGVSTDGLGLFADTTGTSAVGMTDGFSFLYYPTATALITPPPPTLPALPGGAAPAPSTGTGPPYPPLPGVGSNAIGLFNIGNSAIGDISPAFDWRKTVISQYANSTILTQLIQNFSSYVDQTANFDAFYDLVFNVDTAQGYGLDIWGRIVGVNRVLQINQGKFFGFKEGTGDPFGQSAFYSGTSLTNNYALSDKAYRTLIFAKALANISNGSIPSINQLLLNLFPHRGNCYVTDGTKAGSYFGFQESVNASGFNQQAFYSGQTIVSMTIQYVFTFKLTLVELAIVQNSGVLPKPAGVAASVISPP